MEALELVMRRVCDHCEQLGLAYFVTGSVASMSWGEVRYTQDVDIVVALPAALAADFCAGFPTPDWYADPLSAQEAARSGGQFNIIYVPEGIKADIMIPAENDFNRSRLERCKRVDLITGGSAMFATPEDVILKKLEYFREGASDKHLRDIAGIVRVSGNCLDLLYIARWAAINGVALQWEMLRARLDLP